jgi:hypothetical protein
MAIREHTLEYRLFNSTDSPTTFWKNVEFIQALYEYTLNCKVKDAGNLLLFADWVGWRNKRFPNLAKWLADKEYIMPITAVAQGVKFGVCA